MLSDMEGGSPKIRDFDPTTGEVGTKVLIRGYNLKDAEIFFGDTVAKIISSTHEEGIVLVPSVNGPQLIKAKNSLGFDVSSKPFMVKVTEQESTLFTFRGDAI